MISNRISKLFFFCSELVLAIIILRIGSIHCSYRLVKIFLAAAQRQFRLKQSEFNFLLWIASESFSSIYCLWWDLTQDWGLFEKRSTGCRRILRSRILFPRKFYFFGTFRKIDEYFF